jgi:TPR repeat protein
MARKIFTIVIILMTFGILFARDDFGAKENELKDLMIRAKDGNANAQFDLGYKFYKGIDFQQDIIEAIYWFRLASAQDNPDAQAMMGVLYKNGEGVTQDYKEALRLLKKAADKKNHRAQYHLGVMYYAGMGVKANNKDAARYFRLASDQGNCEAQANLGTCYFEGTGVPTSYEESYFWYSLAHELCPPELHEEYFYNKEKARYELTPEKQEEVNQRVAQWLEAYQAKLEK